MASTVSIQGLDEVLEALKELSEKDVAKALKFAGEKEMQSVRDHARQLVPHKSGALARSLGFRTRMQINSGIITTFLGIRKGFAVPFGKTKGGSTRYADPRMYAHLVEFGTVKNKAKPFLGPAIEAANANLAGSYASYLDIAVRRSIERRARKAARAAKKAL